MDEEGIYQGDIALSTPYGTLYIRNGGREITFKLYDSISQNEHNKQLFRYVKHLHDNGIERINCDHVWFPWLDRTLKLTRGTRILDIVYEREGKLYEVELKTSREIWLERTAQQIREFEQYCENLIILVPRRDVETTRQLLQSLKLYKTKVDTYEI